MQLFPASQFSIEELATAYNQTRVDYMVPMPMNAARLAAYIDSYDVNLDESVVAMEEQQVLGLGMLGVRPGRTWITRLGVLPTKRRHGTGEAIVQGLLNNTRQMGSRLILLEVIKGNEPAHQLFLKHRFSETRELMILRRPPGMPTVPCARRAAWMSREDALDLLREKGSQSESACRPAWTNQFESFENAEDVSGLSVDLGMGGCGWVIFRRQRFLLSHLTFFTEEGDPMVIASALISHLYQRYPSIDTYTENMFVEDPHLPALLKMGFIEVFRRIEMKCTDPV